MEPGPDQIVACPHCKGLAKYMTLLSGNSLGARIWTDGKQVAPMSPRPPAVVKCRHCAEYYWLAEAEEIGTVAGWGRKGQPVNPAWAAAQEVEEPTEEEYYQALAKGLATGTRQETNLRVLAWWRRNDAFRDAPQGQAGDIGNTPGPWRTNLEALAPLLDEGDENDRLMKAEVLRELGEFESATQALSRVGSGEVAAVVRQLRLLCDSRDTCVRELQFGA
jgi:hypothetical protein